MRGEFLLFSLADNLGVDIDIVRTWPLTKILSWKRYFEIKAEKIKEQAESWKKEKKHDDGGVHIRRRGGRMVMES